jgi:hypothetical protein
MRGLFRNCLIFGLWVALGFAFVKESAGAVYTLTLQTNGSGAITRNPTNSVYPAGSVVTVTASPDSGWYFSGWTGDATGSANPLNVTMDANKVITGNFQPLPSYTLTTATNGAGSISLNPPGGSYLSNSFVTATATPASGWVFLNWAGDASGNTNPVNVTMNGNKSITAVFAQRAAIDQGPQDVIAEVGDTVSFNVHAVGTPPLRYQWWFDNSSLAGATNTSLTLSNVQLNQEGAYSITVSNAYGAATNSAMLTITNGCIGTNVVTVASEAALRNAMAIGGLVRCCFNGTISLSNTIDVTRDVTLDAHGRSVVISGNNSNRIFTVAPGVNFSATNVVFANGRNVAQPAFPGQGGGIFSMGGSVWLTSCVLVSNSVVGAAAPIGGTGTAGQGGAIFVQGGSLMLQSVGLSNNAAIGGLGILSSVNPNQPGGNGQGGAIYVTNGTGLIINCDLRSNVCTASPGTASFGGTSAAALGGAVFLASGSVTLSNSTLGANMALGSNAPAIFNGGNEKPSGAYGGALAAAAGQMTLMRCQVISNVAIGGNAWRYSGTGEAQGGAIYSSATFRARESTFADNQALSGSGSDIDTDGRGGAIYNLGLAELNACSLIANLARGGSSLDFGPNQKNPGGHGLGGAVFNSSQLIMTNCTTALNLAQGGETYGFNGSIAGGVAGSGAGGGVYDASNGVFTAVNVTIASNSVVSVTEGPYWTNYGFADGANIAVTNGTISLMNSILAYPGTNNNAWGTITDAGYNMSSDGSANFNSGSSFNFTDPLLGPLADNGGPTLTMALSWNSPAVDFGTSVGAPLTDQRGVTRPAGLGFDMGAFELVASPIQRPILSIVRGGNSVWLSFQAQAGASYVLQNSATLATWIDTEVIGPFGSDRQINRTNNFYSPSINFFRLRIQ